MGVFIFFLILFIVCVKGGQLLGRSASNALFPDNENSNRITYIDNSVHHHHHHHEHKNISIIDDATKKKIFELKDKN